MRPKISALVSTSSSWPGIVRTAASEKTTRTSGASARARTTGTWQIVKATAAPAEEKQRAHETCMEILEYWLGKKSKAEVAQDLEVSPLRVWQLSQMALSRMMAGLLTQPRRRVDPAIFQGRSDQTRTALKKRIEELERTLARTEDLVRVLRTAPWAAAGSDSPSKEEPSRAKRVRRKRQSAKKATKRQSQPPSPSQPDASRPAGDAAADRSAAPQPKALEGGSGSAG